VSAAFVWRMEDVSSLSPAPPDALRPVVCFDEVPYQLLTDSRPPLPRESGVPVRDDCEYVRRGTCNRFGCDAPHTGERHVTVTAHRTACDCAEAMRVLVDEWYPDATCVRPVLDNPNTHTGAALYRAFAPAGARRVLECIEWHDKPKHGSWLNRMEIEWSVLTRQCLDRRIGEVAMRQREIATWERERNAARATVD